MKKKLIATVLAATMALMSIGCGNTETAGDTSSNAGQTAESKTEVSAGTEQKDPVTLRFSWWGGDERLAATLKVIEQFEAKYPYITIEPEYGSSDGYNDKLATQLAAGTEPDIIQIEPGNMSLLVSDDTNYFVDLKEAGFNLSLFDKDYISQRINGGFDGKQLGLPTGVAGIALLVNKDVADAIGIDFAQDYTWNDLIEWGKKVRAYDDSMYLLCANKEYLANIVARNYAKQISGQQAISDEDGLQKMTAEDWKKVYEYVQELYDNEVVPPASYMAAYSGDNMQSDPNWIDGKYVCCFTWVSLSEVMTAANPSANYIAGKFPVAEDAKSVGFFANTPQIMSISSRSEHPEEAMMFLDYFFNDEEAMATLGTVRSAPPTERAREICTETGAMSPLLADIVNNAASYSGIVDDSVSYSQEGRQIMIDQIEALGFSSTTPEKAAEDTYSLYENLISTMK